MSEMWTKWITWIILSPFEGKNRCSHTVVRIKAAECYPQNHMNKLYKNKVERVENHLPRRSFAMFTTSPAPIVINMSSFVQFCKRNFSISSKEGK